MKSESKAKLEAIKKKIDVNNLIEYGVGSKVKYRGKWYPNMLALRKEHTFPDLKIVDVKGPAAWGQVVAKRGDRLKVYAYPTPKPKDSITMLGKWKPKRGVDLHLSRKDAQNLKSCLDINHDEWTTDMWPTRERILNKLKRSGIK